MPLKHEVRLNTNEIVQIGTQIADPFIQIARLIVFRSAL
jgi:hypothetical protein